MKQKQNKGKKKTAIKDVAIQKEWKIKVYRTADGKCPLRDFMRTLSREEKAIITDKIEYLKVHNINIRRPHADYIRDKIYELRMTLITHETRVLYFFFNDDNEIILTHAFHKKTNEVSEVEINKAIKYRNDFLQRYSKENINGK
jgi:phage-related protein